MKNEKKRCRYEFNRLITLLVVLMLGYSIEAQEFTFQISWKEPIKKEIGGKTYDVPTLINEEFDGALPLFSAKEKINVKRASFSVYNIQTVNAESWETQYLNDLVTEPVSSAWIKPMISMDKGKSFLTVSCVPFFQENGSWKRILSFQIQVNGQNAPLSFKPKSYVANSVLNSGDWYKISVGDDGVYKIDKGLLESMGVDVSGLNPSDLNVYGNADGVLGENNSDPYLDDLSKNAILFVGNSDAILDDSEYFIFYGAGPNRWEYNSGSGFSRKQHIYSAVNHYFIHIDGTDAPLRVQNLPAASGSPNQTVNSYDYYAMHELELVNLVEGGQRWYGELFSATLSQDFTFNVPDILTSVPVQVEYAVASNGNTTGNNFTVFYNNAQVGFQSLGSVGADYTRNASNFVFNPVGSNIVLNFVFNRVNASVKAYMDYIELTARRSLKVTGNAFGFRDVNSVGTGNISQFTIAGMSTSFLVWDVTDKRHPGGISGTLNGTDFSFVQATDSLRNFMVFDQTSAVYPTIVGRVENQNLHALGQYDYLIVTPAQFIPQAQKLANLHQSYNGLNPVVVDIQQVYNEYSSGNQDATAIRRFAKMFYDRANGNTADQPKYLLLFGDATYDPKNRVGGNNYMIPTYEYLNGESHIDALVTDDYFGLLDDGESIAGSDLMDMAVGRLLITTADHADSQVKKIEHYMKNGINSPLTPSDPNSCCIDEAANMFGDWRLIYTLVTDDEEGGTFISNDAEPAYSQVQSIHNEMNAEKIYSDAYTQISTTGGQRYPEVYAAISNRVERGTQIINYIGHGGEVGAAEERIITIPQVNAMTNLNRLGLFVTATCEFTKFDDPSRESIGEIISLHPTGGSISLMTTTRSIYITINSMLVSSLYSHVFERDANGDPLTFGEIMRLTKNTSGTSNNRRCFNLIGDPALKISIPQWRIVTDSINHLDPALADTVRALTHMHVVGHLEDFNGNVLTGFNGVLTPTIFDKPKTEHTLQNDPNSPLLYFKAQKNALYKGRATVQNGKFSFEFIVPKDIDFNYGHGKISYYADDQQVDAAGWDTSFVVGGINPNPEIDNVGPDLAIYLNDNSFVSGSVAGPNPLLVIEATDDFGINTVGNGIGHDITAVMDGNTAEPIVLNDYYRANLDSYKSGKVQYTLKNLAVGKHTLDVKVWDVNNNSSTIRLEFEVAESSEVTLEHVLNYPNPFTTHTTFYFDHNQSCASFDTQVQVYTVSGRLVKTINQTVPTNGFHVEGIEWDGTDDFGDRLATGVYVYRVSVTMPDGKKAQKLEKLVLLK